VWATEASLQGLSPSNSHWAVYYFQHKQAITGWFAVAGHGQKIKKALDVAAKLVIPD
jgi:hypothetical protein